MRARIIPLPCKSKICTPERKASLSALLVIASLTACKGDIEATAGSESQQTATANAQQAQLPKPIFSTVEIQRSGGIKCPVKDAATNNNEEWLCASAKLSYPQVSFDANPELAAKLNAFILRQMVDDPESEGSVPMVSLEQFADSFIADYQEDPNPFSSWELERTMKVVFHNDELVTLLFTEYGYTGGAHPFSGQRYSVLNLQDGAPVVLADMFSPGYETPLNVTGEKIFRMERALGEADSLEEQGFAFTNNVFLLNENFGVLQEGLDFIFNSYEIAPYAMGPTQFTIPYEDIQSLVLSDGPLRHTIQ